MKRIIILKRLYLERSKKGGYFSNKEDIKVLYDTTDSKLKTILKELNKTYRTNFYEVFKDFNLKTQKGKVNFIKYYIENTKVEEYKELKSIVIDLIKEM